MSNEDLYPRTKLAAGVDNSGNIRPIKVDNEGRVQFSGNDSNDTQVLTEIRDRISSDISVDARLATVLTTLTEILAELQQKIELGQSTLANSLPVAIATDQTQVPALIQTFTQNFRDDFAGTFLDATKWDLMTGTGQSVSIGSSILTLNGGTISNQTLTIRSKKIFKLPLRLGFQLSTSQKLVGQIIRVGIVDSATGSDYVYYSFSDTSSSDASIISSNGSSESTASISTLDTSQQPPFSYVFELEVHPTEIYALNKGAIDATDYGGTVTYNKIPSFDKTYKLSIELINGTLFDASNTQILIDNIYAVDAQNVPVVISGNRGINLASRFNNPIAIGAATDYYVQQISGKLMPTQGTSIYSAIGTSAGGNLKASGGILYAVLNAVNNAGGIKYLQFFDKPTDPVEGDIPSYGLTFPIAANGGQLMIGQDVFGGAGIEFLTGLSWGLSTTIDTYTAADASTFYGGFKYI